jgi:cytochrome oxidase Cu insertion factor (SCO1/SenC/PrrC family)
VHKFNGATSTLFSKDKDSIMFTRILTGLVLLAVFSVAGLAQQPPPVKTHLKVGDPAPDFTLRATDGKQYKLSDFKGKKNVVLAIYVLAFTGG